MGKAYKKEREEGLEYKKPIANKHLGKLSQEVFEKLLELRRVYHLGSIRIKWYLNRFHGIRLSESSVYKSLARHNENQLRKIASRRTLHTRRYTKKVPAHQVQVGVKFVSLED